jgi:hypothetical protein
MNKFKKIFLSILGGLDVVFYIFSPIIIVSSFVSIGEYLGDINISGKVIIWILGFGSTLFRAIKIGWLKE